MNEDVRKPSRRIVNVFGAIGYSVLITVYTVVVGVGLMWLIEGGHMSSLGINPPDANTSESVVESSQAPSGIMMMIAYLITAFMALTVMFVMVTLPYWLGRSGSFLLKRAIRFCQWSVTPRTLLLGKMLACAVAASPVLIMIAQDINQIIVAFVILAAIAVSAVVFLLQHHLAKANNLQAKEIW